MATDDGETSGAPWYFNTITGEVERHERSRGMDLLGPYPDEATARRAVEIAHERNRQADAEDEAWENKGAGGDPG